MAASGMRMVRRSWRAVTTVSRRRTPEAKAVLDAARRQGLPSPPFHAVSHQAANATGSRGFLSQIRRCAAHFPSIRSRYRGLRSFQPRVSQEPRTSATLVAVFGSTNGLPWSRCARLSLLPTQRWEPPAGMPRTRRDTLDQLWPLPLRGRNLRLSSHRLRLRRFRVPSCAGRRNMRSSETATRSVAGSTEQDRLERRLSLGPPSPARSRSRPSG